MITILISLIFGILRGGRDISCLHRLIHTIKPEQYLETRGFPRGAATYGFFHMKHHQGDGDVPKELTLQPAQFTEIWSTLGWAIPFAFKHQRWMGFRSISAVWAILCVAFALAIGSNLHYAALAGLLSMIGAMSTLVCYDIYHKYTHTGGPVGSKLHLAHHQDMTKNYGMWWWHNNPTNIEMRIVATLLHWSEETMSLSDTLHLRSTTAVFNAKTFYEGNK